MFTKLIMSVCLSACSLSTTNAQSPVDTFYRSKNIQLILGVNVGGRYDFYGRLVSRYISKYIPGKPNIIVSNMAGAEANTAAAYVYSIARSIRHCRILIRFASGRLDRRQNFCSL